MTTHLISALALLAPFAAAQGSIANPLNPGGQGGAPRTTIIYSNLPPAPASALPARVAAAPAVKQTLLQRVVQPPPPAPAPIYDKVPNLYPPGQTRQPKPKVPSVAKAAAARASIERLEKDQKRLADQARDLQTRIDRRTAARSQAALDARIAKIDQRHAALTNERILALRLQGKLDKLQLRPSRVLTGNATPRMIWVNPKSGREATASDLPRQERSRLNAERSAALKQAQADRQTVEKYATKLEQRRVGLQKQQTKVVKQLAAARKK